METLQKIARDEEESSFEDKKLRESGHKIKRDWDEDQPTHDIPEGTRSSLDLASQLKAIVPKVTTSQWPAYEHVCGYAVMVLPFSSGDLLGLRVWPQNDFAPYVSVWHCTPGGEWSIYSDGPSLNTTCPRYWGPALQHAGLTNIELTWTGPNELRVKMEEPWLVWTMSMKAPSMLRKINKISAALPLWTWKSAPLLRMREWMAKRFLNMGNLSFSFNTASGHDTIIMPQKMFLIGSSEAVWEGRSLGEPVSLDYNPTIGKVLLPSRPTFVTGQAQMRIKDRDEYRQTRDRILMEDNTSTLYESIK